MVTFNKQLSKNILLVCGELNNWGYKEIEDNGEYDSIPFPKCFELTFKFYDCEFTAYFSQSNIEKESFEPISLEGNGDWNYPESNEFYCNWDKVDCWMLIPEV